MSFLTYLSGKFKKPKPFVESAAAIQLRSALIGATNNLISPYVQGKTKMPPRPRRQAVMMLMQGSDILGVAPLTFNPDNVVGLEMALRRLELLADELNIGIGEMTPKMDRDHKKGKVNFPSRVKEESRQNTKVTVRDAVDGFSASKFWT